VTFLKRAHWNECGGRITLCNKTGVGAISCYVLCSGVVQFAFQLGSPVWTYFWPIHTQFRLEKNFDALDLP